MSKTPKLTEDEKKDYILSDEEERDVKNAFREAIKDTIKDFFGPYGNCFASEDDVRSRIYYHVMKRLGSDRMKSSIALEWESEAKMIKNHGKLDMVATNPVCGQDCSAFIAMEVKNKFDYEFNKTSLPKKSDLELILKDFKDGKIDESKLEKKILQNSFKIDFNKLRQEAENQGEETFYAFFDRHDKDENYEKSKTQKIVDIFEKEREGKNITWVYVIRHSEGSKCSYKTGIVKSNDNDFETV